MQNAQIVYPTKSFLLVFVMRQRYAKDVCRPKKSPHLDAGFSNSQHILNIEVTIEDELADIDIFDNTTHYSFLKD